MCHCQQAIDFENKHTLVYFVRKQGYTFKDHFRRNIGISSPKSWTVLEDKYFFLCNKIARSKLKSFLFKPENVIVVNFLLSCRLFLAKV
jgi:hypothetical protein